MEWSIDNTTYQEVLQTHIQLRQVEEASPEDHCV